MTASETACYDNDTINQFHRFIGIKKEGSPMGKRKKKPETDKEKELLEKQFLKAKIAATIAGIIAGTITSIAALVTAIADCFK